MPDEVKDLVSPTVVIPMTRRDSFTLLKRQLDKQGMLPSSSKVKDTKISKTEKNSPTRVAVDDQKEENQLSLDDTDEWINNYYAGLTLLDE